MPTRFYAAGRTPEGEIGFVEVQDDQQDHASATLWEGYCHTCHTEKGYTFQTGSSGSVTLYEASELVADHLKFRHSYPGDVEDPDFDVYGVSDQTGFGLLVKVRERLNTPSTK